MIKCKREVSGDLGGKNVSVKNDKAVKRSVALENLK